MIFLEKGEEAFVLKSNDASDYIQILRKDGKEEMALWLICLLGGIMELQRVGIFHADLQFRNTIRVTAIGGRVYKIIDMDWAFKVNY